MNGRTSSINNPGEENLDRNVLRNEIHVFLSKTGVGNFQPEFWGNFIRHRQVHITPQIDHQSSGHGHDTDSPYPWPTAAKSLLIPLTEPALRLISQPTPCTLNAHA